MSDMLKGLKEKRMMYIATREQHKASFDQLCGAIHVFDEMIAELEKQEALKQSEGEQTDGREMDSESN
jgi:hypothetical protein